MKKIFLIGCLSLLSGLTWILAQELPRLPEPTTADREVSRTFALEPWQAGKSRLFRLEIAFEATPSNNVQVALGRETLSEGEALDAAETDLCLGWERGAWFLHPRGLRERYVVPVAESSGKKVLKMDIRLAKDGSCAVPVFYSNNKAFEFEELELEPLPQWLRPIEWNALRVTVRGAGLTQERIRAILAPAATQIIIK